VSFGDVTNVLTILSSFGLGVPIIVSERTDPRRHRLAPAWRALRRITYPRAAAVVMQTRALTAWCREFLPTDRIHAIANPVDCTLVTDPPQAIDGISGPFVVAMGALRPEKGFDLLLEAYARLEED